MIDRLEAGLKAKFLQHCDPIRPRDLLIQLTARACICTFRLLILHPLAYNGNIESRKELLETSIRCLEYDVAARSTDPLKCFRLRTEGFFQWSACTYSQSSYIQILTYIVIHVLSEATQQTSNPSKAAKIWNLPIDVYASNPGLSDLTEDPRKLHAAELMVAAWKIQERCLLGSRRDSGKPAPLAQLEIRLAEAKEQAEQPEQARPQQSVMANAELPMPQETGAVTVDDTDMDMNSVAELTFDDIDWSFWLGLEHSN